MVDGWKKDYVNLSNGDDKRLTKTSAWTRPAATSAGVTAKPRSMLDLAQLPDPLREHITKVAIPAYEAMVSDNL